MPRPTKKPVPKLIREYETVCFHNRRLRVRIYEGKPNEADNVEPCPACDAHRDYHLSRKKRKEGGLFDEQRIAGSEYD